MPRVNPLANFFSVPDFPTDIALPPSFSLVVPVNQDVTNIVTNPSFELDTTNWSFVGSGPLVRSTTRQFVGAYSLNAPSGVTQLFYGSTTPIATTAGNTYIASARFFSLTGNLPYDFYFATSAGVRLSGKKFRSSGFWQYVWTAYTETGSSSRRLYFAQDGSAPFGEIYVDAVQVEEVTSGSLTYPTTYIDGDQRDPFGLTVPASYYWNGTPHASTSVRSGLTRSGGRVMNLKDLGVLISAVVGLGLPLPQIVSSPFTSVGSDGESYSYTRKEARTFSIAGRVTGRSTVQLDQLFGGFSSLLDRDDHPRDAPMILKYQPMDEQETPTGPELNITAVYTGGLEGQRNNLNTEVFTASFKQFLPIIVGHSEGASLGVNQNVTANGVLKRSPGGTWSALSTGLSGGASPTGRTFARHTDGTIYIGGNFTDAGGSGADYAAKYNPIADSFSVVKAATTFNDQVYAICVGPDGSVYFGGAFTNADGIANADGIVKYNPVANTFSALGTGVAAGGTVEALAIDALGNLYAGGTFTGMGGVANTSRIAKWDGANWTALGTGGLDSDVRQILVQGTKIWAVGGFTQMGGVANTAHVAYYDTAWHSIGGTGADAIVTSAVLGPDYYVYFGGGFDTIGGITAQKIARWNGVSIQTVGSASAFTAGAGPQINRMAFAPNGLLYIGGAQFVTVGGIAVPDNIVRFNGSSFELIDIDLPGTASVLGLYTGSDGMLYVGFDTTGTASAASVTTVTNGGTCKTYPTFIMKGPSSGTSRLYSILNITTGQELYFNYTINAGETAILSFDSNSVSFMSDFQGDVSSTITNSASLFLAHGSNRISVLTTGAPTIVMYWQQAFLNVSDAVGRL